MLAPDAPGAMENQVIRLPAAVRRRVEARATAAGVKPARLYRAYIEAGDRADRRREARAARTGQEN
jgi:hypothetical protein